MRPKTPPAKVLQLWTSTYKEPLTNEWRVQFLKHKAMRAISSYPLAAIQQELPHHKKLDDLLGGLRKGCHHVKPGGGASIRQPTTPRLGGPKPRTTRSKSRWDGSDADDRDWAERDRERKAAVVDIDRPEPYS